MSEKKNNILIIITAALTVLYALSFVKSCTSKDNREKVKTALINPKYKENISRIELSDATGNLELINQNNFWIVKTAAPDGSSIQNNELSLPVSKERLENFLTNLITIRNLYKISDKINNNSSLGLTTGTEFHIRYYYNDTFRELIFGNQDFSLSCRYLMTGESTQVYETDGSLDTYLTTQIQSWAEPLIISQLVSGKITAQDVQRTQVFSQNHSSTITDIQKLLDLRHGGLPSADELLSAKNSSIPDTTITLELGNKNEIEVKIYQTKSENEYIVLTAYKTQKTDLPYYTSTSKISSWTYNKIKEITL